MTKPKSPWTPGVIKRLGDATDSEIAAVVDRSIKAVGNYRRRLGIERSPRARLNGRHWTAAEDRLLGTMADRDLAEQLGCSKETVERRRVLLGISGWHGRHGRGWPSTPDKLVGATYYRAMQGGLTPAQIAKKHKVTSSAVVQAIRRYRRRAAKPQRVARAK